MVSVTSYPFSPWLWMLQNRGWNFLGTQLYIYIGYRDYFHKPFYKSRNLNQLVCIECQPRVQGWTWLLRCSIHTLDLRHNLPRQTGEILYLHFFFQRRFGFVNIGKKHMRHIYKICILLQNHYTKHFNRKSICFFLNDSFKFKSPQTREGTTTQPRSRPILAL